MAKTSRKRIPKPFRVPRPMASQPEPMRLGRIELDVAAIALATLVAAVAPLRGADEAARGVTVGALAGGAPSEQVMLVTAAPEDLRAGACAASLRAVLEEGRARGALLLPPADAFCADPDAGAADALSAVPITPLPLRALRLQGGDVVGFILPDGPAAETLRALGVSDAPWVVARAPGSAPEVGLRELAGGAIPATALSDRVALVAVGSSEPGAPALSPAPSAAAALGGLLDGGRRLAAPFWIAPLFVLLAGLAMRRVRRHGALALTASFGAALAALFAGQALLAANLEASLLPVPSALLALGAAFSGVVAARVLARRRAVDRAAELLERAALFRMQGVHTLPDDEFWPRVARLAEQAHPADIVIVAELPPESWHLRFWNDQRGGESLVAERRRDVRRMPYSNDQAVPTIHVARRFLTKPDIPTVVVPLIAFGEIEGFVFLCGAVAEATFTREPERAERLSRELALLVRRKRLAGAQDGRRAGETTDDLVEGARVALEDLRLFGALLRHAPAGLLYADAFGDVRFVSQELAKWLRDRDVSLPPEGPNATLPPGSLTLGDVIAAAADGHAFSLASVMSSEEGIEIGIAGPDPGILCVRALRQQTDGLSWIAGYVAALLPLEQIAPTSMNVRALAARESADPLCAFPLGEIVAESVAAAARSTGRSLRLEPIRGLAHAIGHKSELSQALEAFLVDVAGRGLPGHGPVVSVRETSQGVQLSILDVGFGLGLPESALQRVLMAPGAAPAGLEPLGRLILAVEDSHGHAELKTNDGWGITLAVTLLRAHPRVAVAPPDGGKPATPNVIAIGRKHQG